MFDFHPSVMALSDEFTKLVAAGSFSQASAWLYAHEAKDAFAACFASAVGNKDKFRSFWDSVPSGPRLQDLLLDLVYYGYMPQAAYGGVGIPDYDTVRELFLRSYEKSKLPSWWPSRATNSKTVCLYPEYRSLDLRATIVALARRHVGGGPSDPKQANLFCLGGRYKFSTGKAGANPPPPGTTCMLFARSIWHAAGINVISNSTPVSCSCDKGLAAEIKHLNAYVDTQKSPQAPTPKPGDVFHIQGKNFKSKGGSEFGSAHVGIIINVAGNQWTCIQGGASDHVTRLKTYTVVPASNTTWGSWCFEEDFKSVNMIRGIHGYWSVDLIGTGHVMSGGK